MENQERNASLAVPMSPQELAEKIEEMLPEFESQGERMVIAMACAVPERQRLRQGWHNVLAGRLCIWTTFICRLNSARRSGEASREEMSTTRGF